MEIAEKDISSGVVFVADKKNIIIPVDNNSAATAVYLHVDNIPVDI